MWCLTYTQLRAEQGGDLQLHHRVFAPGVTVGDPHTFQHGVQVVIISLLSGGDKEQRETSQKEEEQSKFLLELSVTPTLLERGLRDLRLIGNIN